MSALQEFKLKEGARIDPLVLAGLGRFFWHWYHEHSNDVIIRKTAVLGLFKITVLVKDVRFLFTALFGPE